MFGSSRRGSFAPGNETPEIRNGSMSTNTTGYNSYNNEVENPYGGGGSYPQPGGVRLVSQPSHLRDDGSSTTNVGGEEWYQDAEEETDLARMEVSTTGYGSDSGTAGRSGPASGGGGGGPSNRRSVGWAQ